MSVILEFVALVNHYQSSDFLVYHKLSLLEHHFQGYVVLNISWDTKGKLIWSDVCSAGDGWIFLHSVDNYNLVKMLFSAVKV